MARKIRKPRFELHHTHPCGGWISEDGEDTGAFLQGDDCYSLESELEGIEKLAKQKKIGWNRYADMVDDLISQYLPD